MISSPPAFVRANLYEQIYGLPTLPPIREADFEQCSRDEVIEFVVLVVARECGKECSHNSAQSSIWGTWRTDVKRGETPEQAAVRFLKENSLLPVSLLPIALLLDNDACGQPEIRRWGLAFLAPSIPHPASAPVEHASLKLGTGVLRQDPETSQLLELAEKRLDPQRLFAFRGEVMASYRFARRLAIHRRFIKPIFRASSSQLRKKILQYATESEIRSVIDVSAGDDLLILEVADRMNLELCVANDLSFENINLLSRCNKHPNVLFTLHDATMLPFRPVFDLAICKNTLHHMHNEGEVNCLLESLQRVAKRILIVDIEDPRRSGLRARIYNLYHTWFLGDQGKNFFSREEFSYLISSFYKGAINIRFDDLNTVRGRYLFASVEL